jgi:hypothetical protein
MEYAFEGDRLADDHEPRPSVFTAALVEGLRTGEADRDEDGLIGLTELYEYVFERVRDRNPNQTPSRDVEMQGELYLARSNRKRIRALPMPADLRAATTDPNMFTRLGAVGELRARLASDNLQTAMGAFAALKEMAGTDIQNVVDAAMTALGDVAIRPDVHLGSVVHLHVAAELDPARRGRRRRGRVGRPGGGGAARDRRRAGPDRTGGGPGGRRTAARGGAGTACCDRAETSCRASRCGGEA